MQHVYPLNDEREHVTEGTTCWCDPKLDISGPELIVIHNSADCRELIEQAEVIKNASQRQ